MIEIDVKLLPYGQRDKTKYLKRIHIANEGTTDIGRNPHHYYGEIMDPDDQDNILTGFTKKEGIQNVEHNRGDGVLRLLYKTLQKHFEEKDGK